MVEAELFSTPMMQQFMALKAQYPDCVIWFRLGDFYEMFLEHAELGAQVLNITLTSRARGKDGRIPMAGVPYHAAETYLGKLIQAGYKVAICEQVTEPTGKGLVERRVVRIVTPGTLLHDKFLPAKTNNFVACLLETKKRTSLAVVDVTTGEVRTENWTLLHEEILAEKLATLVQLFPISEWIVAPETLKKTSLIKSLQLTGSPLITSPYNWETWFKAQPHPEALDMLRAYLEYTQQLPVTHLQPALSLEKTDALRIDQATLLNLELFETLYHHQRHGSLFGVLDKTLTAMGGRLLAEWLRQPLNQRSLITKRQDKVSFLTEQPSVRQTLTHQLSQIRDIERLISRLSLKAGTARDVVALGRSLQHGLLVLEKLKTEKILADFPTSLLKLERLATTIEKTLVELPAIDAKAGAIIQDGVDPKLDSLRQIINSSQSILAELEKAERQTTGISSLKIKYNQVFGFYIEISKANLHLAPSHYFRKQTLVNAERFITPELKKQEDIILAAEEAAVKLEQQLVQVLIDECLTQTTTIQQLAKVIAESDCLVSLAEVALQNKYVRPKMVDQPRILLKQSRHPVVEQLLPARQFIPNDISLNTNDQQIMILTGPNMAGKSVLMRQVAVITLMAHLGSFVPATAAEIGVCDQIFVRSGASDIITSGLSTFMVEMVETAAILNQATSKSLVIMDEIGRGTSTYDGISIAWAIAEELLKIGCQTMFATHYHELQKLSELQPTKIKNFHMAITDHQSRPVFLYQLQAGGASHSFGIAVAELAGLPASVITKAQELLAEHEQGSSPTPVVTQKKTTSKQPSKLQQALDKIDPNSLTPLEALNTLARLKKQHTHVQD